MSIVLIAILELVGSESIFKKSKEPSHKSNFIG